MAPTLKMIAERAGLSQSTVSQHLGKLRQAGIIEGERNGLEITYRLKDERVKAILSCLFSQ